MALVARFCQLYNLLDASKSKVAVVPKDKKADAANQARSLPCATCFVSSSYPFRERRVAQSQKERMPAK